MTRYIRPAGAAMTVLVGTVLILRPGLWSYTPVPETIGTLIHLSRVAADHAAFMSRLVAAPNATELSVPVVGVHASQIADTYGDTRSSTRMHEGTDIFAPRGTYVVSATEGIVLRVGRNELGGNIVVVLGPGREVYYYAHLDSFDPELSDGQRVGTTTILGRVGTTGNATGTPPHLHFGIYAEREAINPYPRLRTSIDNLSNR